jgi:hypothetical protein
MPSICTLEIYRTLYEHEISQLKETNINEIHLFIFNNVFRLYINPVRTTPSMHRLKTLYAAGTSPTQGQVKKFYTICTRNIS